MARGVGVGVGMLGGRGILGCLVSCFLVFWFLGFKVSKFLGFKVSNTISCFLKEFGSILPNLHCMFSGRY